MTGPYMTEREAIAAARPILDLPPGTGAWTAASLALLEDACALAGLTIGAYDRRILAWLSGCEPQICAVIAGLIDRACESGASRAMQAYGPGDTTAPALSEDGLRLVFDALEVAAGHKREVAANCPECEIRPGGLCPDCGSRLDTAKAYDELAGRLGSTR